MGLFGKKKRSKKGFQGMSDDVEYIVPRLALDPTETTTSGSSSPQSREFQTKSVQPNSIHNTNDDASQDASSTHSTDVSIEQLGSLVDDLAACDETFAEAPARALRTLFALSEHPTLHEINRIRLTLPIN
jgi:hypothetical protein